MNGIRRQMTQRCVSLVGWLDNVLWTSSSSMPVYSSLYIWFYRHRVSSHICYWLTRIHDVEGIQKNEGIMQSLNQVPHQHASGTYSTISAPMERMLDMVHTTTGMPWWMTLVAGGVVVRASLYPLSLRGQKATEVVVSAFSRASREVKQQKAKGTQSIVDDADNDKEQPQHRLVELARDYVAQRRRIEQGTPNPVWMILSPAIQISVLVYGLYSVRSMANHDWPGFDSGGPPWAVDLTLPAVDWTTMSTPLGAPGIIMPGLLLIALHYSIRKIRPEIRNDKDTVAEHVQIREWALSNLAMLLEVLTVPLALGVLSSPQAPLYYWATGLYTSLALHGMSSKKRAGDVVGILSPEAQALLEKAAQCVSQGLPAKASPYLYQALLLHPQNRSIHLALGQVSSSLQKWKDSEYHYNMVAQGHHKDILEQQALFGCAMALLQVKGRREEAIDKLQRASRFDVDGHAPGSQFKSLTVRSLVALAILTKSPSYAQRAVMLDSSVKIPSDLLGDDETQ